MITLLYQFQSHHFGGAKAKTRSDSGSDRSFITQVFNIKMLFKKEIQCVSKELHDL
jgi:hypothetical protein